MSEKLEMELGAFERLVLRPVCGPINKNAQGECAIVVESAVYENTDVVIHINPYPTAFPYGNGMVLHFYQQQESSTTKIVHKVINKGLKTYV